MKRSQQAQRYFRKFYSFLGEQEAEDFGSWCLESWLKGRDIRTDLKFMAVDYRRANKGKLKQVKDSEEELEKIPSVSSVAAFEAYVDANAQSINERKYAMLALKEQYGLQLKEIAAVFRLDPSRVSQILASCLLLALTSCGSLPPYPSDTGMLSVRDRTQAQECVVECKRDAACLRRCGG